jgi:transposase-like protein
MTPDTPEKLDELTPHQLITEIQQIATQYAAEVPGSRRNWPESVRSRILALGRLGITRKKIAELTGIPAATVFLWCRALARQSNSKQGHFIELKKETIPTVRLSTVSPTVRIPTERTHGLSLRTPAGFLIEGFKSIDELLQVYREVSR